MNQQKPIIVSVPNALSTDNFEKVRIYAYESPYFYGEHDGYNFKPTGMSCGLNQECEEDAPIINLIESVIREKFPELFKDYKRYRAYINCFAAREDTHFHTDCGDHEDEFTFLFYANESYNGLDDGGTTEFYLDGKVIAVPPIPNTLVKFTSWVLHRATSLKSEHRFTYVLKYRRIGT